MDPRRPFTRLLIAATLCMPARALALDICYCDLSGTPPCKPACAPGQKGPDFRTTPPPVPPPANPFKQERPDLYERFLKDQGMYERFLDYRRQDMKGLLQDQRGLRGQK